MTEKTVKTTVYLETGLLDHLRNSAKLNEISVFHMLNDIIRVQLTEDTEDIAAIEERKNEIPIPYDEFVKRFKKDGLK